MSGHSKWATTKHQKAVTDARRSSLFTKIANLISVSARSGGDPTVNFQLRLAIDKARAANMPKDKIEREIKRGTGELGGNQIEEVIYEAYGIAGTAILIEALTDNKNRTSGEIKGVLNKLGGKLAETGSVSYLFSRRGSISVKITKSQDEAEMLIIDSGAEDYQIDGDRYLIYSKPDELFVVKKSLEDDGFVVESAELVWEPNTTIELDDEQSQKAIKLLEALDELDDVSTVSSNLG
jgi:YebC/PmpR family DNA-binding regulatory protein